MKQYLVILLDDTSTSYCHYLNGRAQKKLISIENLKAGINFAMKENLMIQYVLPEYELSIEYKDVMNSIDSHLIVPSNCKDVNAIEAADVIVFNNWADLASWNYYESQSLVIRTSKEEFFNNYQKLTIVIEKANRINVVFTDSGFFNDTDFDKYAQSLTLLSDVIVRECINGHFIQFNLLTDRIILNQMNNCGAGDTNITLAPDGLFYICPAFYYNEEYTGEEKSLEEICQKNISIGSLKDGLIIKNPQLYKLEYSPICNICDAYQCKRCIWMNRKTTLEVNTPSHEQCMIAHIERNASRKLLAEIRKHGSFLPDKEIKQINYLDPFDLQKEL